MGTYKLPSLLCKGAYSSKRLGGFQGTTQKIFLRAASEAPDTQTGCLELASWFATRNRKDFNNAVNAISFGRCMSTSGVQGYKVHQVAYGLGGPSLEVGTYLLPPTSSPNHHPLHPV